MQAWAIVNLNLMNHSAISKSFAVIKAYYESSFSDPMLGEFLLSWLKMQMQNDDDQQYCISHCDDLPVAAMKDMLLAWNRGL